MTTIAQELHSMLYNCGLFEKEADAILANLKARDEMKSIRWNDDLRGYPSPLLISLWMSTRAEAVVWIDANRPKHWARPLFVGDMP